MKGTIILIACLLAMVLMVTFSEGKPVAKNHEEATEDPEPDTNEHESEDHEVYEESEKESKDEHSESSGHLSDASHYPLPGPPFSGPYPGAGPEPYPEHGHYPEFPGPYPNQHLKKYKQGDKGKEEKKLGDKEKEKEHDKHDLLEPTS